jgi:hypothetical protein
MAAIKHVRKPFSGGRRSAAGASRFKKSSRYNFWLFDSYYYFLKLAGGQIAPCVTPGPLRGGAYEARQSEGAKQDRPHGGR